MVLYSKDWRGTAVVLHPTAGTYMCPWHTWVGNWHRVFSPTLQELQWLLHGRLLPGTRFNTLTLLEHLYDQEPATATERNAVQLFLLLLRSSLSSVAAQKKKNKDKTHTKKKEKNRCFSLKAVREGRTALCEEETSLVSRCLQLWQKQSHPKWLMSRQAGCEEQSTRPFAELAVGIPQGELGCSDKAERGLGVAYRAHCTEGSWCFNRWWFRQGLISRPHTV